MKQTENYTPIISGGVFGISCHFPVLQDIIDYEENTRIPNQGYPRFIPHPYVREVEALHLKKDFASFAVQNIKAANHVVNNYFTENLRNKTTVEEHSKNGNDYAIIYVPTQYKSEAKEDICNAGIILNARKAYRILNNIEQPQYEKQLTTALAALEKGATPELTFAFNSGMAAIYSAVLSQMKPGKRAVVIGSCYIDSHKLFSKLPQRFAYLPTTFLNSYDGSDFDNDTAVVFLEIPSNPLLQVEDIDTIVEKAHKAGAIVIVDSTIATPHHFSPFSHNVDIIAHSTSKGINGKNDHMGGALFINPAQADIADAELYKNLEIDAQETSTLLKNMADFDRRIKKMAANAAIVKSYLENEPKVEKVYSPKGLNNGAGHVISFIIKNESKDRARTFYDNCGVRVKGPSMGYEDTMLMPYSLMTRYYDTDDELRSMGLSRFLMRLSVGTEDVEEIIGYLKAGFEKLNI